MPSTASATDFIPVNHSSLTTQVTETLRSAIFAGNLKPGDSIKERRLANKLNVSQATVREALIHLESYGLVVRMRNRGTVVTNLTRREAEERIAIRINLESWALVEAARRMTAQQFQELDERLSSLAKAVEEDSYLLMTQGDLDFHRHIWRFSGNTVLSDTLDRVSAPLFAFISFLNRGSPEIRKIALDQHRKIIDALRTRDPQNIHLVIAQHIAVGYESGRAAHLTYGYE